MDFSELFPDIASLPFKLPSPALLQGSSSALSALRRLLLLLVGLLCVGY